MKNIPICEVPGCCKPAQNITGGENPKYRRSKWVREEHNVEAGWVCSGCHGKRITKKHGVPSFKHVLAANAGFTSIREYDLNVARKAGFSSYAAYMKSKNLNMARKAGFSSFAAYMRSKNLDIAREAGFSSYTAYMNSKHPYLKYRKTYCENIDGRLGFKCTYEAPSVEFLVNSGLEEDYMGWLQVDHIDGNSGNNDECNLQTLCATCHTIKTAIYKDYATPGRKTLKKMKEVQASGVITSITSHYV